MDSIIKVREKVNNVEPRFGSQKEYYPCNIECCGFSTPALFTKNQIDVAIDRAMRNPEDIMEDKTFWDFLFGILKG